MLSVELALKNASSDTELDTSDAVRLFPPPRPTLGSGNMYAGAPRRVARQAVSDRNPSCEPQAETRTALARSAQSRGELLVEVGQTCPAQGTAAARRDDTQVSQIEVALRRVVGGMGVMSGDEGLAAREAARTG